MLVKIRSNFLIGIPKIMRNKLGLKPGNVVEVIIEKNFTRASFITLIQSDNRIKVRALVRETFNMRKNEEIEFKARKLKEIPRSKNIVKNNEIDVLSLIPEKTRRGFPIRAFDNNDKIIVWSDISRGHPSDPLIINRFVSLDFCKFLGLIQAEGQKFLNENGGSALTFTNIFTSLHKVVLDSLRELGVPNGMIKLRVPVPEGTKNAFLDASLRNFLQIIQINPKNIRVNFIKKNKRILDKNGQISKRFSIKNIAFTIKVERTLLAEVIINGFSKIRKFLSQLKDFDKNTHMMACNFLSGVLMGDGTTGIGISKNNKTIFRMFIKDPDILHLEQCERIFNTLDFKTSLKRNEELPRLVIHCNWNLLVWTIFRNRMLKEHPFHWIKLILIIQEMKQWKKFMRFKLFNGNTTTTQLRKEFRLTRQGMRMWLRKRGSEGLVKGIKNSSEIEWKLTKKGEELRELLIGIEQLKHTITNIVHINDFNEIRKIIKNLNGKEIFNQNLMMELFRWVINEYHIPSEISNVRMGFYF